MSHDIHFLTRLERLQLPHVDTAMVLYRDAELLRAVLEQSPLPDGAERVAISLADPVAGPFILVERNGHFVTCLAEGMRTGDLPVVPRERLDHIIQKVGVLRERFEAARQLVGGDNVAGKLLERLAGAGLFLSREEFLAITAVQPLMHDDLDRLLLWALRTLESYRQLGRDRRQAAKLDAVTLQNLFLIHGLVGHLAILFAMDSRQYVQDRGVEAEKLLKRFVFGPLRQGTLGMAVRGVWAAGKFGKLVLPMLKQIYMQPNLSGRPATKGGNILLAGAALLAIAARSEHYRGEIGKFFERDFPHLDEPQRKQAAGLASVLRQVWSTVIIDADAKKRFQDLMGVTFMELATGQAADSPLKFSSAWDVPRELGIAALASSGSLITENLNSISMLIAAAGVARAEPQELYFPDELIQKLTRPWRPSDSRELLAAQARTMPPRVPIRVTARPGRNETCPCGSGQKYKRCCGRD